MTIFRKGNFLNTFLPTGIFLLCFALSTLAVSQTPIDTLKKKFDTYRKNTLQEKLFVHTNQEIYLTGEQIWFKVYYFDGSLHHASDVSAIAYADLLDKNDSTVAQVKVALAEGAGSGYLTLPATIKSGTYRLRTYTSWMKNFSPGFYFQKPIIIINPFRKLNQDNETVVDKWEARFFPEGGTLVNGLPGQVAFQVLDKNGQGMEFKGTVLTSTNDTLLSFKPLKFGLGKFHFTPTAGIRYRAVIKDLKGRKEIFDLPVSTEAGYVMSLKDSSEFIVVTVQAKTETIDPVYLFIHSREVVTTASIVQLRGHRGELIVEKKKLSGGISHITLFDSKLQPACERLYYRWPKKKLNIDVQADLQDYGLRSKVTLSLVTKDQNQTALPSMLSLSVFRDDSLAESNPENIHTYLWLTSDLQGTVESPQYYTNGTDPEVRNAMDNVMLTHGWRRFKWSEILGNEKPVVSFVPEVRGHLATGVIKDNSGSPAAGVPTSLATPGASVQLYGAVSNDKGEVTYELRNFYGSGKVIAQRRSVETDPFQLKLLSPYSTTYSSERLQDFNVSPAAANELLARTVGMQVQGAFRPEEATADKPQTASAPFYGDADEIYLLDDYTRFPLMEEVMREYIKGVWVRKNKDGFRFMIVDKVNEVVLRENPLILLDGVPVMDPDRIIEMDPLKIKSLEVYRRIFHLGPLTFPGIVSFKTYAGDPADFVLEPQSIEINYDGLQKQREFYSPVYETIRSRESRRPDRRYQLYWSPNVITDAAGKQTVQFYTSDVSGTFTIVVQGSNGKGVVGSTRATMKVRGK